VQTQEQKEGLAAILINCAAYNCPGSFEPVSNLLFFFFFFFEEEALHVSRICHRSNISGQLKETSGMKAYTARPTTGEAALPWQAIRV